MTVEEFKAKMTEDNWTEEEINEILELRENALRKGINPPPLEAFVIGAVYEYKSGQKEEISCN